MTVKKYTKSVVLLIKPNCFFVVLVAAATQTDKFSGYLNKFFLIRNVMVQKIE